MPVYDIDFSDGKFYSTGQFIILGQTWGMVGDLLVLSELQALNDFLSLLRNDSFGFAPSGFSSLRSFSSSGGVISTSLTEI